MVVENWKHGQKFLKALDNPESNLSKIIGDPDTSIMIDHENVISFRNLLIQHLKIVEKLCLR